MGSDGHVGAPTGPTDSPGIPRRQTRLILVSDIRLYREGLRDLLGQEGFAVLEAAPNLDAVLAMCAGGGAVIVLIDMALPGSEETVRALAEALPHVNVVGLAVPEADHEIVACAELGLAAFVLRDASLGDLVGTLEAVEVGEFPASPKVAASLLRHVRSLANPHREMFSAGRLTRREVEIVELIGQGMTNGEIARRLSIQISTVKNHVHHILEKLQLDRRSDAALVLAGRHPVPRLPSR